MPIAANMYHSGLFRRGEDNVKDGRRWIIGKRLVPAVKIQRIRAKFKAIKASSDESTRRESKAKQSKFFRMETN